MAVPFDDAVAHSPNPTTRSGRSPAGQAAPAESTGDSSAEPCGALPPSDDTLGIALPCELVDKHKVHRSAEGTWPA